MLLTAPSPSPSSWAWSSWSSWSSWSISGLGVLARVAEAARAAVTGSGPARRGSSVAARCLIDPVDGAEAVVLLRTLTRDGEGLEEVLPRLVRLYKTFEPREPVLRALSMWEQQLSSVRATRGGQHDFAVAVVYSTMTLALMEGGEAWRRRGPQRADVRAGGRESGRAGVVRNGGKFRQRAAASVPDHLSRLAVH